MYTSPETAQRGTVAVVDDTRDSLRLLEEILAEQGYHVRPALQARRALADIQANPPDLILLDIMMPEMDGYAVCAALKADERTQDIPVIFISALHETFDKMKAFSMGGVDYITKPYHIEEVLARVATHMALRQMQKQLQEKNTQLEQEIAERMRAEAELRQLNSDLAHLVGELEQHNRDQSTLNRMSSFLQRSQSRNEAIQGIRPFLNELFADQAGALYLYNSERELLEQAATWGTTPPAKRTLCPQRCRAATNGRVHVREELHDAAGCGCLVATSSVPAVCMQLVTRGELLGVLQVERGAGRSQRDYAHWMSLAVTVADLVTLALANLQLREHLHEQAIRDPLTGLFNRRFLEDALGRELNYAARHQRVIGIMMLDIDHFKRINDTYGHDAGDAVLRTLGQFLRTQTRNSDFACRYGGEEIILVFPEASLDATRQRAEILCANIRDLPIEHEGELLPPISVSIGVAAFPQHGTTPAAVITAADDALYHAKAAGRNRVLVADVVGC